jgi:hypothetical protein
LGKEKARDVRALWLSVVALRCAVADTTLTIDAIKGRSEKSMRNLLASHDGITFTEKRCVLTCDFTVTGSEQAIAALRVKIAKWEIDEIDLDAW